jgi:hypothetical protein
MPVSGDKEPVARLSLDADYAEKIWPDRLEAQRVSRGMVATGVSYQNQ